MDLIQWDGLQDRKGFKDAETTAQEGGEKKLNTGNPIVKWCLKKED